MFAVRRVLVWAIFVSVAACLWIAAAAGSALTNEFPAVGWAPRPWLLRSRWAADAAERGPRHRGDGLPEAHSRDARAVELNFVDLVATPGPNEDYLYPDDPAPSFSLRLLDNATFVFDASAPPPLQPVVVHAVNFSVSSLAVAMWTTNSSVDAFLQTLPPNTRCVFGSYRNDSADSAAGDVTFMRQRLLDRMSQLNYSEPQQQQILSRLSFVADPVALWPSWIVSMFTTNWTATAQQLLVNVSAGASLTQLVLSRLDARYDWLPSFSGAFSATNFSVALFGDACSGDSFQNVSGKVALVSEASQANCSFFTKVQNAQNANATGVIVFASSNSNFTSMNCEASDCSVNLNIPATMIAHEDGIQLVDALTAGANVTGGVRSAQIPGMHFAIDHLARLQEVGYLLYPSLQFLAWQAQWLNFSTLVWQNRTQQPADTVVIFPPTIMQGEVGVLVNATLPPLSRLRRYTSMELDMSLSCPGRMDAQCPPWDRTIVMSVCCNNASALCNQELGRWISSFHRRIGSWLSHTSPLLPLLSASFFADQPDSDGVHRLHNNQSLHNDMDENITCTFNMKTDWWAQPWLPSLSIRFGYNGDADDLTPFRALPLFQGGDFNQTYNDRDPVLFTVPSMTKLVRLAAIITGHGSDNFNCAEFCVTSHRFVFNNNTEAALTRTFNNAGTPTGCADRVMTGVEPNEGGTWLYGRNGWCDGNSVQPWVSDVTSQLKFQGVNSVQYWGLFNGENPNPSQPGAYIIMASYLVFYA